jgi:alpha-L-fucosidase 2
MNYWAALPGNLPETTLPYFDYYGSMLEDFRINAKAVYGSRGILAPIAQTTHGLIYADPIWAVWTAGAGWLAQLFYDYWLFTGDMDFLKNRTIPFLKEVALFYEDFLVEGQDGKMMFIPSMSPENNPSIPNASLVTINATMDVAIAREVLTNLCTACELLGIEEDGRKKWKNMLDKLPEYRINEDGAIKEWIHTDLHDNYHHRHQSHIYPLFPGFEVTEESDPVLFNAIKIAVEKRLVVGLTSQTGWSFAHMANIYARLGDGVRALQCLELLCRSCVGPNLFTYHNDWRSQGLTMFWGHGNQPPFQIDANFGLMAAVLEMLIFSAPGMIKLLPALPPQWRKGKAEGIACRGCIEVNLDWNMDAYADDVISCGARGIISEPYTDYKKIAKKHKDCFLAGEGDNRVLYRNDPGEIRAMVESMVETAHMTGGYMMCIGNHIPWNIPGEAIKRYLDYSQELALRSVN